MSNYSKTRDTSELVKTIRAFTNIDLSDYAPETLADEQYLSLMKELIGLRRKYGRAADNAWLNEIESSLEESPKSTAGGEPHLWFAGLYLYGAKKELQSIAARFLPITR